MITVISPAKSLDFESALPPHQPSEARFLAESEKLVNTARKLKVADLQSLMDISEKLALLNVQRFRDFALPMAQPAARAAVFAFDGDVYTGLEARTMKKAGINFAQNHLRILSGLYGLLRPLDLILPYRLEMGLPFAVGKAGSLYAFWGTKLSKMLMADMQDQKSQVLVNLASQEYFAALQPKSLGCPVITPVFKELRGNKAQIISYFAKQARGRMARFIIDERIDRAEGLKDFSGDGYAFDAAHSTGSTFVFARTSASLT
jgi:uncharacterized protein